MQNQAALKHWQKLGGIRDYHGVATPLLALRSYTSQGCGDFEDLRKCIDWLSHCGMDILQLLPLNDTGFDASPYAALSAFSLNPVYIHINKQTLSDEHKRRFESLEALTRVPYKQLRQIKLEIMRQLVLSGWGKEALLRLNQLGQASIRLLRYAQFMAIKDYYQGLPWWQWPQDKTMQQILEEPQVAQDVDFYQTIQAVAHEQLKEVALYARLKGLKLMGDLPILLCKDSAEVLFERELFDLEHEAGAPPDQYSDKGQKWGFPVYRWARISEDGYNWWQERLSWAENYFDMYRIDHVAGFFGLWTIQPQDDATKGCYYPKDPDVRLEIGQARLKELLDSCDMLPVGEDLGQIDPRIRDRLSFLAIPGIKVVRWHRQWEKQGQFIPLDKYPKLSLSCLSTHDSSTLRQWWHEEPQVAAELCQLLGLTYSESYDDGLAQEILRLCHTSSSALHIDLLVDYLDAFSDLRAAELEDYRINTPGTIHSKNWTLRYSHTIEELAKYTPLEMFWRMLCAKV